MGKVIQVVIAGVALCCLAFAQVPRQTNTYTATKETALSAAAEVITVQQPASSAKTVVFRSASVYCSVACTVTLERDGTAATGTALTPAKVNANAPATTVSAWYSSDVGTGTTISKHSLPLLTTMTFDLSRVFLIGAGTAKNFTVRTNSITGTVVINLMWDEY